MSLYSYSAKNLSGEVLSGVYEADSIVELKKEMYSKGYFVTKANETGKNVSLKGIFNKVKMKDFVIFCRQFSIILNAGMTVVEAVAILIQQTQSKKLKQALSEVHEQLLKGSLLSNALGSHKDVFPEFFMNMVKVGEATGSLDMVLNRLAEYYEKESKIKKKVKSACMYPMIVVIIAIGVIALLMLKVLPTFADMLSSMGGQLPLITVMLINISKFMTHNIMIILLANMILISALVFYVKTETGRYQFDLLKLRLPIIRTLSVKMVTSKFARSMGLLLQSGIPIVNAMDIISNLIGNRVVEDKFKDCSDDIKGGKQISISLNKMGVFPPMLIKMVSVGENTGELDEMLSRTAVFFDEEVEESIGQLTTMIEPIMIIFLAVIVGTIILAVMLPMVNIMQSIQ